MSVRIDGFPTRRRGGAILTAIMMITLAAAATHAADSPALRAPVERTLGNGLRVVVFPETRLELVQFQLRVPAGLLAEPPGQAGVAYIVTEMLRRGTTSRDPRAFADAVERTGGSLVPSVGRDYATLSGTFLARDFEAGIELMSDGALYPVFDEDELRRVRAQGLRQLAQTQRSPGLSAEDQVWKGMFGLHPYARSIYGEAQMLASVDAARVRTFWSERWRPDHAVLAIAGDITPERAFLVAEEWFGRWTGSSETLVTRPSNAAPERVRIRLIDRPGDRAELRIGTLGPARGADDEFALLAAGSLFGGAPSRRSNGVRTLYGREVSAGFLALGDAGLFTISASAPIDSAALALRSLTTMMGALATPASAEDFTSVQRLMKNMFQMSLETLASQTSSWLAVDFYGNAAQFFDRYYDRVDGLTPPAVASAAQRWIDPAHAVIVVAGPAARLRPQLERLGDVEIVSTAGASSADAARSTNTPDPATAMAPTAAERQRGRELVKQAVVAHGGLAKLRAIRDSRIDASLTLNLAGQKLEGLMHQARREPDRMVYVTEIAGISTRQTLLGNHAWQIARSDSVAHDLDSVSVDALRAGFSSDLPHLLLAASDPKASVWARGTTAIGDVNAMEVVVEHSGNVSRTLHLHPVNHRVIGFDQGEPGSIGLARRKFSVFKTVDGILWPYREDRQLNGETIMIVDIQDVRLNTGVPDIAFEKPVTGSGSSR